VADIINFVKPYSPSASIGGLPYDVYIIPFSQVSGKNWFSVGLEGTEILTDLEDHYLIQI